MKKQKELKLPCDIDFSNIVKGRWSKFLRDKKAKTKKKLESSLSKTTKEFLKKGY